MFSVFTSMWSSVLLLATVGPLATAFASNCDILRLPSAETWNGGGKGYLNIPIHEDIQDWDLQINFDRPVDLEVGYFKSTRQNL